MKSSIVTHDTPVRDRLLMPVLLVGVILLLASGSSSRADGGNRGNPGILPPKSHAFGKSYRQWAAAWWQWAFSIPVDQNPVVDETGEFSGIGQAGPVFFLAGNFGGTTVRECTVPAGKALFFPLLNGPWVQFPSDPIFTIPELRAILAPGMDNPQQLLCEIDGKPVRNLLNYRVQSSVFSINVPEGGLLDPGTYSPCVDDGYYLMLAPLAPGSHTLHIAAANSDGSFSLDVTYQLAVQRDCHRDHDDDGDDDDDRRGDDR